MPSPRQVKPALARQETSGGGSGNQQRNGEERCVISLRGFGRTRAARPRPSTPSSWRLSPWASPSPPLVSATTFKRRLGWPAQRLAQASLPPRGCVRNTAYLTFGGWRSRFGGCQPPKTIQQSNGLFHSLGLSGRPNPKTTNDCTNEERTKNRATTYKN